jgi:hypothetical protein
MPGEQAAPPVTAGGKGAEAISLSNETNREDVGWKQAYTSATPSKTAQLLGEEEEGQGQGQEGTQ